MAQWLPSHCHLEQPARPVRSDLLWKEAKNWRYAFSSSTKQCLRSSSRIIIEPSQQLWSYHVKKGFSHMQIPQPAQGLRSSPSLKVAAANEVSTCLAPIMRWTMLKRMACSLLSSMDTSSLVNWKLAGKHWALRRQGLLRTSSIAAAGAKEIQDPDCPVHRRGMRHVHTTQPENQPGQWLALMPWLHLSAADHATMWPSLGACEQVDCEEWNATAVGSGEINPFVLHGFLQSLETSSSAVRLLSLTICSRHWCMNCLSVLFGILFWHHVWLFRAFRSGQLGGVPITWSFARRAVKLLLAAAQSTWRWSSRVACGSPFNTSQMHDTKYGVHNCS